MRTTTCLPRHPVIVEIQYLCLFAVLCATVFAALGADNPPKFDNDQARVLVVTSATDAKSALHDHKVNRVMIYLDPGEITLTEQNGNAKRLKFKAGEALWS